MSLGSRELVKTPCRISYLVFGKIISQGKKASSKLSRKRPDKYIVSPNEGRNMVFIAVVLNL